MRGKVEVPDAALGDVAPSAVGVAHGSVGLGVEMIAVLTSVLDDVEEGVQFGGLSWRDDGGTVTDTGRLRASDH